MVCGWWVGDDTQNGKTLKAYLVYGIETGFVR